VGLECSRPALLEQAQCSSDPRPTESGLLNDLHHPGTFSMQTDDLLAPFMQHSRDCLRASSFSMNFGVMPSTKVHE
jgi:hypothetical protein